MGLEVEDRPSDSPYIERVWRSRSHDVYQMTSIAAAHWDLSSGSNPVGSAWVCATAGVEGEPGPGARGGNVLRDQLLARHLDATSADRPARRRFRRDSRRDAQVVLAQRPLAWKNTQLNRGDLAVEIPKLKQQPGKDIGIGGSVELVRSLLKLGLLDRLRLQVYPTALGATGTKPIFEGFDRTALELVDSKVLDGQVVFLDYQTAAPST